MKLILEYTTFLLQLCMIDTNWYTDNNCSSISVFLRRMYEVKSFLTHAMVARLMYSLVVVASVAACLSPPAGWVLSNILITCQMVSKSYYHSITSVYYRYQCSTVSF